MENLRGVATRTVTVENLISYVKPVLYNPQHIKMKTQLDHIMKAKYISRYLAFI